MEDTQNVVLQFTDLVSTRQYVLRIDPEEASLPLRTLLQRYLKRPAIERLRRERRITAESAETLASIQDLVYISDDQGRLHDMFPGIAFSQGSRTIALDDVPRAGPVQVDGREALIIDLAVDRTNVGYDRNWVGFHKRRWTRHADTYSAFVRSYLDESYGVAQARTVLELDSTEQKLKLVEALARRIWDSDFENYSRFVGRKLVYKSGDETVRNIIDGAGGICSEKVQALKFLTDHYGLSSELVLAGPDIPEPVPEDRLRELLTTFDFRFAKRHMRYWQHTALLYAIDGTSVLVDATNGNIPFLFLRDSEADRLLGYESKPPITVRMAVSREDFYYHRVSRDIGEKLFFAMEGWIPYVDLVQVFDNELGLYISKDFMVTSIVYGSDTAFENTRNEYLAACERVGLQCDVSAQWRLDSALGQRFADQEPVVAHRVLDARDHLLARYDECHGTQHQAGLVVIRLRS